jgi:hypothetical protein
MKFAKRNFSVLCSAALLAVAGQANAANPAFTNAGFENGTLSGWTATGNVVVESNTGGQLGSYSAMLTAGLDADVYTTLTQSFYLGANQFISGRANFIAQDSYDPLVNDNGYVSISGPSNANLFNADIQLVGDYGTTGWKDFKFTANTAGTYTLKSAVRNVGDNNYSSSIKVDFASPVPEAETYAMLLAGLGLLGTIVRRRKAIQR